MWPNEELDQEERQSCQKWVFGRRKLITLRYFQIHLDPNHKRSKLDNYEKIAKENLPKNARHMEDEAD